MTNFRAIPHITLLASALLLAACSTPPSMPMGAASVHSMAAPDKMMRMDEQMKIMQGMHEKMMSAKTREERSELMAEHKKAMQNGMDMMGSMSNSGSSEMKGMDGGMDMNHQMMAKRMEMMQTMMKMMMDQMPSMSGK